MARLNPFSSDSDPPLSIFYSIMEVFQPSNETPHVGLSPFSPSGHLVEFSINKKPPFFSSANSPPEMPPTPPFLTPGLISPPLSFFFPEGRPPTAFVIIVFFARNRSFKDAFYTSPRKFSPHWPRRFPLSLKGEMHSFSFLAPQAIAPWRICVQSPFLQGVFLFHFSSSRLKAPLSIALMWYSSFPPS